MLLGPSSWLHLSPETVLDVAGSCCSADNTLITRRSFAGQHWHSHGYQGDNTGVTTTPGGAQPRVVRSLVYPLGFEQEDDGGLKVVRVAHLYRASVLADGGYESNGPSEPGDADDDEFRRTWLKDKSHPLTGRPLKIEKLELPRGSIACVLGHVPHAVSPRPEGRGSRLCTLLAYRQPGPVGSTLADGTLVSSSVPLAASPPFLHADFLHLCAHRIRRGRSRRMRTRGASLASQRARRTCSASTSRRVHVESWRLCCIRIEYRER